MLTWATKNGHTVAMITLTMRHHLGHRLADSWTAATSAWGGLLATHAQVRGDSWAKIANKEKIWEKDDVSGTRRRGQHLYRLIDNPHYDPDRVSILGFVRALEATYGMEFGWHPHIHAVLIFDGAVSPGMVRMIGERMYAIWAKGLAKKDYTAIRDSGGLDIRVSTEATEERLAEYFCKGLAVEATHGHAKAGKQHGRAPFQVLADCATRSLADATADLEVWWEWEEASFGRQQLTYSEGLKEMAGVAAEEKTDDELAAEEVGDVDRLHLPAASKGEIWRSEAETDLLDVAEAEGVVGAERWLRVRGLVYSVGVAPPPDLAPP